MTSDAPHVPEQVLWSGRLSQWYFFGYWLLALVVPGAMAALFYMFRDKLAPWLPWAYVLPLIIFLVIVCAIAWQRSKRSYKVTNLRVVMEYGRWAKDTQEIRIQDIRSINVSKSGLAGLVGIGKLEFSSSATDDADVIFYQISGADRVRDLVRRLQS